MRQPLPLAAASKGSGEQMLCILANIFYMFDDHDAPDTAAIRERLWADHLYHHAGELLPVIFLLREGNFQVHSVGETNIRGRTMQWLGAEVVVNWFGHRLTETPRHPTTSDIDMLIEEGCAIIVTIAERYGAEHVVPASCALIAESNIYSPAESGLVVPYDSSAFENHWNIHQGIIAVHPA